jgi:hypothetical protein
MAALKITEIIRKTLTTDNVSNSEVIDTYIPAAVAMFEALTNETITLTSYSSGNVSWDIAIAYFAISVWYGVQKEAHMVSTGELSISAEEWWAQVGFRRLVTIGYSEFFEYTKSSGLYTPTNKNIPVFALCAVSDMTDAVGDEI